MQLWERVCLEIVVFLPQTILKYSSVTVVLLLINLLSRCSWKNLYRLSDFSAFVLFRILGYRKAVINENLRKSFPEKSGTELRQIKRRFYTHFTDLVVETIKLSRCSGEEVLERMFMSEESERHFKELKNGAVVLLGHRGNWELANLYISLRNFIEPVVVYRPLADAGFEDWFRRLRTRFGSTMSPMKKVYEELERERDKPYAVYLVNDQSPNPHTAYWTEFLNQDTGVFRGAEVISRKYESTVLFADIRTIEGKRGYYEVELKLFTDKPSGLPRNAILENQIRYLEKNILAQPYNWLWSHKRWKHRKPAKLSEEQLPETSDGWKKAKQNF